MNNKQRMKSGIILGIFTLIFLIVFAIIAPRAGAEEAVQSFNLLNAYGHKYHDVNKPSNDGKIDPAYDMTCVHAAMATAISYSTDSSATEAFGFYLEAVSGLGNKPVTPIQVWDHMMDQVNGAKGNARYNNYTTFQDNVGRNWDDIMMGMLYSGWVVLPVLESRNSKLKHIITVYGYQIFKDGSMALTYVDSDDKHYGIQYAVVDHAGGETFLKYNVKADGSHLRAKVIALACVKMIGE